jgi:hypothetical protein
VSDSNGVDAPALSPALTPRSSGGERSDAGGEEGGPPPTDGLGSGGPVRCPPDDRRLKRGPSVSSGCAGCGVERGTARTSMLRSTLGVGSVPALAGLPIAAWPSPAANTRGRARIASPLSLGPCAWAAHGGRWRHPGSSARGHREACVGRRGWLARVATRGSSPPRWGAGGVVAGLLNPEGRSGGERVRDLGWLGRGRGRRHEAGGEPARGAA